MKHLDTGCVMSGKGDGYRPVDKAKFEANYDRIFGQERKLTEVERKLEKGERKSFDPLKGKG